MDMAQTMMGAADALACALITWQAVVHLGRMNHKTRMPIRLSFLVLAVGAFATAAAAIMAQAHVDIADLVAHAGVAALLVTDRRRPTDCPHVDDCEWQRRHPTPSQWS